MQEIEVNERVAVGMDLRQFMQRVLSEREFNIICLRYGLFGAEQLTLELVGRTLHITKERVRQIQTRALQKLREISPDFADDLK